MDQPLLKDHTAEDLVVPDYPGWHPIHIAAYEGDYDEVLKLIREGAYISPVDVWGKTPLHYARRRKYGKKNDEVARLLLQHGAKDIEPLDSIGRSPQDIYIEYN